MEFQHLLTSIEKETLTITINRPAQLNALNISTLDEIHRLLSIAQKQEHIRGIIITGSGDKAFAAGADIKEFAHYTPEQGRKMASEMQMNVFNLMQDYPKPIIAAINGYALGGGLELALAAHIRISVPQAKLGLPEVSLGLIPGYGGTQRLTQLIGRGRALELILTAQLIDAKTALEYGMLNHVVAHDQLLTMAQEILDKIYKKSRNAVELGIKAVNGVYRSDVNGFTQEIELFSSCFGTADFKEGIQAFLEKRKANF